MSSDAHEDAGESLRVAVVGGGISGLLAAWLLARRHEVTLFEAAAYVGGHTRTVDIEAEGRSWAVDTGFVVYNEITYPGFCRLLELLGVESQPSDMSFSVRVEQSGLEYNGTSLNALFAQRRNLLSPGFLWMLREIMRFNRQAPRVLQDDPEGCRPLGEFLASSGYSDRFRDHYITPMGAALWSMPPERVLEFPALFFVRFFRNHGLLTVDGQYQWRVVKGGSRTYVQRMLAAFPGKLSVATPVRAVARTAEGVRVATDSAVATFDQVVLGLHADQALGILVDPRPAEREVLAAFPYQSNEVVLHRDERMLPRAPLARASWNYLVPREPRERVAVTYDMSRLQRLDTDVPFCVTLNGGRSIADEHRLLTFETSHPVFTPASESARRRHAEISGRDRIHFCGAYWGNGFHEDGVRSAMEVGSWFGTPL